MRSVSLILGVLFCALSTLGSVAAQTTPTANAPSLAGLLPSEMPRAGEGFQFVVTLSWEGAATDWFVRSIDGPSLTGLRELGHRVDGKVETSSSSSRAGQTHLFTLIADEAGHCTVGAIDFVLLAAGGEERRLSTKAFAVEVRSGAVSLAELVHHRDSLFVGGFVVCVLVLLLWMRARRRARRLAEKAAIAQEDLASRWTRRVEALHELAAAAESRTLYEDACKLMSDMLAARSGDDDNRSDAEALSLRVRAAELSSTLTAGLVKICEDSRLVRFAGLEPGRDDRDLVVNRLEELAHCFDFIRRPDDE